MFPLVELAWGGTLADVDREIDCIKLPVWAEGVSGFRWFGGIWNGTASRRALCLCGEGARRSVCEHMVSCSEC